MQTKFDASCELLGCQSERRRGAMVLFASRAKGAYERHIINHDWAEMMCELDFIELSPCEGNNIVWCWWTRGPNGSRLSQHQNKMQQQWQGSAD